MAGRFFNLSGIWFGAQCYAMLDDANISHTFIIFITYISNIQQQQQQQQQTTEENDGEK